MLLALSFTRSQLAEVQEAMKRDSSAATHLQTMRSGERRGDACYEEAGYTAQAREYLNRRMASSRNDRVDREVQKRLEDLTMHKRAEALRWRLSQEGQRQVRPVLHTACYKRGKRVGSLQLQGQNN